MTRRYASATLTIGGHRIELVSLEMTWCHTCHGAGCLCAVLGLPNGEVRDHERELPCLDCAPVQIDRAPDDRP